MTQKNLQASKQPVGLLSSLSVSHEAVGQAAKNVSRTWQWVVIAIHSCSNLECHLGRPELCWAWFSQRRRPCRRKGEWFSLKVTKIHLDRANPLWGWGEVTLAGCSLYQRIHKGRI